MIILRQREFAIRHEIGLNEKGKDFIRTFRHEVAKDLDRSRKNAKRIFQDKPDKYNERLGELLEFSNKASNFAQRHARRKYQELN